MKKLLITLEVPSVAEQYDMFVPPSLEVGQLLSLLSEAVSDLSRNRYISSGQELLCIKETEELMAVNRTVESYGLRNGDHLILF